MEDKDIKKEEDDQIIHPAVHEVVVDEDGIKNFVKELDKNKSHQIEDASTSSFQGDRFKNEFSYKLIGSGNYGRVYYSVNKNTGRVYAIKSICLNNGSHKNEGSNETIALSNLNNENIPEFHCFWYGNCEHEECNVGAGYKYDPLPIDGIENNKISKRYSLFIQMEYCGFAPLKTQSPTPIVWNLKDTKEIMKQLIGTVNYMHGMGFIHGDLHPGNILAFKSCTNGKISIKLIDLGLSNKIGNVKQCMDRHTDYTSIEQNQLRFYDKVMDIYSIIVIYYEMILQYKHGGSDTLSYFKEKLLSYDKIKQLKEITQKNIKQLINNLLTKYKLINACPFI